jgi:hypothetical protein
MTPTVHQLEPTYYYICALPLAASPWVSQQVYFMNFFEGAHSHHILCAWFMYMNHDTIWLTGVRSQSKGTATALRLISLTRSPSKFFSRQGTIEITAGQESCLRSDDLQKTRLIHHIFDGLVNPVHRTTTVSTKVIYPCMCNFEKLHLRTLYTKFRATVLSSSWV